MTAPLEGGVKLPDGPQDGVQTAAERHTVLDRAHVPGPYVRAGHSFGGLYILTFAATYPDQVAGMVLLDSTAPVSGPPPTKTGSYDFTSRISALLPALAHFGVARLYGQTSYGSLPPRSRDEARAAASTTRYVESVINELSEEPIATHQAASLVDFCLGR